MMSLYLYVYLFILALVLTIITTVLFKNKGPWRNPIWFFVILFMTAWSITLWFPPATIGGTSYPYASVTLITLIIMLLLASATAPYADVDKVHRLKDKKVVEVVTNTDSSLVRLIPNAFFWVLVVLEFLLIILAYVLDV